MATVKVKHYVLKSHQKMSHGYGISHEEVRQVARRQGWMTETDPQGHVCAYVELQLDDHDEGASVARVAGDGGGNSMTSENREKLEAETRRRQGVRRSHKNTHKPEEKEPEVAADVKPHMQRGW